MATNSLYTDDDLLLLRHYPHLLGHLIGFDKLTEKHSDMILYLFDKDRTRNKKVWSHRGSYKSTAVVVGIVWRFLFFPEERIFLYRKSFSDATATLGSVLDCINSPVIQELFFFAHGEYPKVTEKKMNDGRINFSFKKTPSRDPSIQAASMNSKLTGKHASLCILDDCTDMQSRVSPAERRKDMDVYREIVTNICNKDGVIRIVGTPWTGFEHGIESLLVTDPAKGIQACDNFKVYHIEDMGIISKSELEEIRKSTTASLFAANYLMKFISSDDAVFRDPEYGEWDHLNCDRPRGQIDAAFSKEGDKTALTIAATNRKTGFIHAVGFLFNGNVFDHVDAITEKLKDYGCRKLFIETNRDAGWAASTMKKQGFSVSDYVETSNKNNRISVYGLESWERTIWDDNTDPQYMNQILDWLDLPSGAIHDDAPDSYASLMQRAFSKKNSNSARWVW